MREIPGGREFPGVRNPGLQTKQPLTGLIDVLLWLPVANPYDIIIFCFWLIDVLLWLPDSPDPVSEESFFKHFAINPRINPFVKPFLISRIVYYTQLHKG